MLNYQRNPEKEFFINLKISSSLPEEFDPKYHIGSDTFLIWESGGIEATRLVTEIYQ